MDKPNCMQIPSGRSIRILQLTDIHIGAGCLSQKADKLAFCALEKIVNAAKADFIVVTGDIAYPLPIFSGTRNNFSACKHFAEFMEKNGVPWALVFGNHDAESFSTHTKEQLADYYQSLPNCLFQKGECLNGAVGNYSIELTNSENKLVCMLMFLDSNAYLGKSFFSGFDVIHDDQIEWYKRVIAQHSTEGVIPSLAFFHIPPKEFKEGWQHVYKGDGLAEYKLGFVQEKDNYFGYPKTAEGNFFKEMVKLGSCKGMFVGHDHLNTVSLQYMGIRLTYGMSIDYLAYRGIRKRHTQRGGTLIDINDKGEFSVSLLPLEDING